MDIGFLFLSICGGFKSQKNRHQNLNYKIKIMIVKSCYILRIYYTLFGTLRRGSEKNILQIWGTKKNKF